MAVAIERRRFFRFEHFGAFQQPYMPVEFSAAAYRFGHSTLRESIDLMDPDGKPIEAEDGITLLQACEQAGIPRVKDVNAAEQEGATWYQLTVKNGLRQSAAVRRLVEDPAVEGEPIGEPGRAIAQGVGGDGSHAAARHDHGRPDVLRIGECPHGAHRRRGVVRRHDPLELVELEQVRFRRERGRPRHRAPGPGR